MENNKRQIIRNELRNLLIKTYFKKNNIKISSTNSAEPYEVFRMELGSEESARNKLMEIFADVENVIIADKSPEIISRINGGSSTYPSFTIEYKGQILYVANKTIDKANLKNKELSPEKLGLAYDENMYNNSKQLIDKFMPIINEIDKKYKDSNIKTFIECLVNTIVNSNKDNFNIYGSFNEENIDDFFSNEQEGKVIFNLDNINISDIKQGDINCIEKDFGEVIGPLVFFKLYDNVELVYPTKSNEPLVDYYINGHKISAKKIVGGGNPSGSSINKEIKNNINNIKNNPKIINNDINDLSSKEEKNLYENYEIKFIEDVISTYDLDTFNQQRTLINNFVINPKEKYGYDNISEYNFIQSLSNYKNLANILDDILKNKNIKEWFEELYEKIGYNISQSSEYTPEKIEIYYKNNLLTDKQKWGILFYPLYKVAIDRINEIYGNYKYYNKKIDVISQVIQKTVDMKQIYFGIYKNSRIKFEIVSSKTSKWMFTTGGMSTNNISNSKLAIKLKNH